MDIKRNRACQHLLEAVLIYIGESLEKSTRVHEQCLRFFELCLFDTKLVSRSCSLQIILATTQIQLIAE